MTIQAGKEHRLNIRMSGFDLQRLDKLVQAEGKKRSAIIRQALREYYDRQQHPLIKVEPEPQRLVIRREVVNG